MIVPGALILTFYASAIQAGLYEAPIQKRLRDKE